MEDPTDSDESKDEIQVKVREKEPKESRDTKESKESKQPEEPEETFRPPARAPRRPARDNFLAEAVRPRSRRLTYGDGFRVGIGFITAQLLVLLITGVLAYLLIVAFKLHI